MCHLACGGVAGSANFEDITKNDSKPNEAGLSRNGKTISLVDLTLLPAADDFMMLSCRATTRHYRRHSF